MMNRYLVIVFVSCMTSALGCNGSTKEPDSTPYAVISTPRGPIEIPYIVEEGYAIFQGDIILGKVPPADSKHHTEFFRAHFGELWPNGKVWYAIDPDLPDPQRVTDAINHWQQETNFQFIRIDPEEINNNFDWLYFDESWFSATFNKYRCYSEGIGRQGGQQKIVLGDGCLTGTVIHEIGHAVGLHHEQSRADRDEHVIFDEDQIDHSKIEQFRIFDGPNLTVNYTTYDVGSIMHYSSWGFHKDEYPASECLQYSNINTIDDQACPDEHPNGCEGHNYCPVLATIGEISQSCCGAYGSLIEGQRVGLSAKDIAAANILANMNGCWFGDGLYCGHPAGLDTDGNPQDCSSLYRCENGAYTLAEMCDDRCYIANPGKDDSCDPLDGPDFNTCDTLPFPEEPVEPVSCDSGACCDTESGMTRPTGDVCESSSTVEFYCQEGDVYQRKLDRLCSGTSTDCNGDYSPPIETLYDDCLGGETCSDGDPTCNGAFPDCTNGACCDPSGNFRPSTYICELLATVSYVCTAGTDPGDDVFVQYRDRYCSGTSSSCNGSLGPESSPAVYDFCSSSEVCDPGDPSCDPAPTVCGNGVCETGEDDVNCPEDCCTASDYWFPSSGNSPYEDGLTGGSPVGADVRIEWEETGSGNLQHRYCKQSGNFSGNSIYSRVEEELFAPGLGVTVYSNSIATSSSSECTPWRTTSINASSYSTGDHIAGSARLVSPSSSDSSWGLDTTCVDGGSTSGACWDWTNNVINTTRTCKP